MSRAQITAAGPKATAAVRFIERGARIGLVRRFTLAVFVALLAFSASGVSALFLAEPCSAFEQPAREDDVCPPTCVTCGCCAQAAEPVIVAVTISPDLPIAGVYDIAPAPPQSRIRGILHVPRPRTA